MIKLNDYNKSTWVDALTTYPKTRYGLKDDRGYCCLGVAGKELCDMSDLSLLEECYLYLEEGHFNDNLKQVLEQQASEEMIDYVRSLNINLFNYPTTENSRPKVQYFLSSINDNTDTFEPVRHIINTYL